VAIDLIRRMFDRAEDSFRALVEEGQRSGEIPWDRDPVALGALLQTTAVGLRLMARITEGPGRLALVIDATIDSL
jgi:TetR/AcrR family transcriptional repressor of nem operon